MDKWQLLWSKLPGSFSDCGRPKANDARKGRKGWGDGGDGYDLCGGV